MIDRRHFLSSGATIFGIAACGPIAALGPQSSPKFVSFTFRWVGGQLSQVSAGVEQLADYVVIKTIDEQSDREVDCFDVFVRAPAPEEDERESILSPLGRHQNLETSYRCMRSHIRTHTGARVRQDQPDQGCIPEGTARGWPAGLSASTNRLTTPRNPDPWSTRS